MLSPFRHCPPIKHLNHAAALAITNNNIGHVINGLTGRHNYADDKGQGCCKDTPQTVGMKVEPWPKPDMSPQPWRPECPQEPQPPNYDPYRIKVPDTVVPPLPPSNVKPIDVLNTTSDERNQDEQAAFQRQQGSPGYHQGYHQQGYQKSFEEEEPKDLSFLGRLKGFFERLRGKGKDDGSNMMAGSQNINWLHHYWKDKPSKRLAEVVKEVLPNLGYHGKSKYKYAFHEPWKPLDRIALLQKAEQQELELIGDTSSTSLKAET